MDTPALSDTGQKLRQQIKQLLSSNLYHGYSEAFQTEHWTIHPSPSTYPFQYFWDTCLHAFILTNLGEAELATKTFRSLYAMQAEDGFVGHMLYWDRLTPAVWTDTFQARYSELGRPHMSALIQPPLSVQALERIWQHAKDDAYLKEMLPKLKKHFNWLATHRDLDGDGLITIINLFESGIDWKPTMDELYHAHETPSYARRSRTTIGSKTNAEAEEAITPRGRADASLYDKVIGNDYANFVANYSLKAAKIRVKEVAFNTIYACNLQTLADLCRTVGDADAEVFAARSRKVSGAIQSLMYDAQAAAFWDITTHDNRPLKTLTPTIFFPIALPTTSPQQARAILDRHFHNEQEFATKYPLPSVAVNDPAFDPEASNFLWRGPTWALYNWFIYHALWTQGFKDEANTLQRSVQQLMYQSGFREYYNPLTGEGGGAEHFTWSGLIVDMVAPAAPAPPSR